MGNGVGGDYLDNKKLTTEQLVLLGGVRVICTECGNMLLVPTCEKLFVLCRCGNGWGIDSDGLFVIEKAQAQAIWEVESTFPQN